MSFFLYDISYDCTGKLIGVEIYKIGLHVTIVKIQKQKAPKVREEVFTMMKECSKWVFMVNHRCQSLEFDCPSFELLFRNNFKLLRNLNWKCTNFTERFVKRFILYFKSKPKANISSLCQCKVPTYWLFLHKIIP